MEWINNSYLEPKVVEGSTTEQKLELTEVQMFLKS